MSFEERDGSPTRAQTVVDARHRAPFPERWGLWALALIIAVMLLSHERISQWLVLGIEQWQPETETPPQPVAPAKAPDASETVGSSTPAMAMPVIVIAVALVLWRYSGKAAVRGWLS